MSGRSEESWIPQGFKLFDHDLLLGPAFPEVKVTQVINMELEPDDVIVASYPKTGTTFLQEVVWLIRNRGDTDLANQTPNVARVPFMELGFRDNFKVFSELPRPRAMKTHLPYRYLPKAARDGRNKVVYTIRNPKDCLVSYYHFYRMSSALGNFQGSWDEFFKYFMDSKALLEFGNPLSHFRTYWEHKNDANLHIVFYENMVSHPHENIRRIAEFLGYKLDDEVLEKIVEATRFETMKKNPMTNMTITTGAFDPKISLFMRKGKIGDWKNYFNEEQSQIIDAMTEGRLKGLDIKFTYE